MKFKLIDNFFHGVMPLNDADVTGNSEEPDQTSLFGASVSASCASSPEIDPHTGHILLWRR